MSDFVVYAFGSLGVIWTIRTAMTWFVDRVLDPVTEEEMAELDEFGAKIRERLGISPELSRLLREEHEFARKMALGDESAEPPAEALGEFLASIRPKRLFLCEARGTYLEPDQLYRTEVGDGCAICERLADEYRKEEKRWT